MMKRIVAFGLCVALSLSITLPARAQVVSDPVLEHYETMKWWRDINNAAHLINTDIQTAQMMRNQFTQYQEAYHQLHDTWKQNLIFRNAQQEIQELANITKAGYSVSAYDQDGSSQLQKVFPEDPSSFTPAQLDQLWHDRMQSALTTAVKGVNVRMGQMNTEEGQIAAIRGLANNKGLSQLQMMQAGLMIADQQLEELRSLERVMLQHFATQYQSAYRDASGGNHDGVLKLFQEQALESFFRGSARGPASGAAPQSGVTPQIPQR